jgi:hypothetical protein
MRYFTASSFRDLPVDPTDAPRESYGLRYGRNARARRDHDLPHFGVPGTPPASLQALPSVCFADGRAC